MTLGMFYAGVARTAFKGDGQQSLHHFWEMVSYIANTLIFILSGVVIAEGVLTNEVHFGHQGTSWWYLLLLYVFVQLSRAFVVGALYPFLRYFGYGLDWREAIILVWSGLRGAVALALSLSVKRASDSSKSSFLSPEVGILFVFFTGGIVFFTLVVNGSTTQFILHFLKMDELSAEKIRVLNYTRYEMLNKAMEAFTDLGDDEELGPVDWPTVKRYITCLSDLEGEQEHPHTVEGSENHLHHMNLRDMRVRLLNGVQAAYWDMLDEGRITSSIANILMQSIDEAMDQVSDNPLCDWKGLKAHVHIPTYYRFLQISRAPRRLVTYFTVERLDSACYICAAFLRAHRIARMQLHEFIGDSEIASIIIDESNSEGEDAKRFLEDVRVSFPQVLRAVKTKQVTYSILKHLSDYVQNLEKVGLLEEKERLHLDDAVQTDLKKLLRNPPLIKMPKLKDLLSAHPLLGALPVQVREPIQGSTKEIMKMRGVVLFKEGSKSNGIWLVCNGVVKWTSNNLRSKKSLHPAFSHGSTLGLYEVLVGKPYLCNMITDSVVHCFFIEADKIVKLLRSDPAIESFLWQESALIIAKLFLPQVFEKFSLQDLRVMITERSKMKIFLSGEMIEVHPNNVCFLLEGFVKLHDNLDGLITSPAALVPSNMDISFLSFEPSGKGVASFCHRGTFYQVVARARVIFFEVGAVESSSPMLRATSWINRSVEGQRIQNGEHSGLMGWPENLQRARSHHRHYMLTDQQANSLSARAMELNIFGSMVNRPYRRYESAPKISEKHSMLSSRVPSSTLPPRPLVPVKSEGESLSKRLRGRVTDFSFIQPTTSRSMETRAEDNSSDESGGEEEVIVRIDSPSNIVI